MSILLKGLKAQPDFPKTDITEDNARMVAVMLANPKMLDAHHKMAEDTYRAYFIGHNAIVYALDSVFSAHKSRAASVGVAIYEAVSSLVQPQPSNPSLLAKLQILPTDPEETIADLFGTYSTFLTDMPKTAEVVEEIAAPMLDTPYINYAVLGAGAARSFELKAA